MGIRSPRLGRRGVADPNPNVSLPAVPGRRVRGGRKWCLVGSSRGERIRARRDQAAEALLEVARDLKQCPAVGAE
jgi:hypothetical protein